MKKCESKLRIEKKSKIIFLRSLQVFFIVGLTFSTTLFAQKNNRPNIILIMADDLGYGDVGYNNPVIKTPYIDQMAKEGVQLNRFYVSVPVCSPTRASILTGRNPYRYGVYSANVGHLKKEELCLAEVLQSAYYSTGHFGKWHLGTLTTTETDGNRGKLNDSSHYSSPWMNGFDVSFSTEARVPTWNPMVVPANNEADIGNKKAGEPFGTSYWISEGQKETSNLDGDDSRIIMDRVIPFIKKSVNDKKNFFAVVWFHTPHLPVITGDHYRNFYKQFTEEEQHYFGAITAMDEQIGRLRLFLKELKVEKNTIIIFNSDNGPEGSTKTEKSPGSALDLRGRKRSLYEGGIRVPAIMVWPAVLKTHKEVNAPLTTTDFFPTILSLLDLKPSNPVKPIDGIDIMPILNGKKSRSSPICFQFYRQIALIDDRYKLYSPDRGVTYELYDLLADRAEKNDLSREKKDIVDTLKKILAEWLESCKQSDSGQDYN